MATITSAESVPSEAAIAPVSLISQVRTFLWLASGMFSTSALALAFLDYWVVASSSQATTHFVAAVVSAALFGVATVFKLGPAEA
ncbi:MAG TPA: hypothetical protein VEY12_04060 [Thermoplasmata archaeon]|nr:hypothetical protein [Thermoplasmata archaeon]